MITGERPRSLAEWLLSWMLPSGIGWRVKYVAPQISVWPRGIAYADCSQPAGLTASDIVWGVCYLIDAEKEDEVRAYLGMCRTDHMLQLAQSS